MNRPDPGGSGSADISAISPGSLSEMINELAAQSKELQGKSTLKRRLGEYGIGMTEFQNIINVGQWIDDELPMLRRRLSLAQALENAVGPGLPVHLYEPVQLPSPEDLAEMKELAEGLKNWDGTDAEEGARLYHEAAEALAASGYDPDLMSAFFAELGPLNSQMLAERMTSADSGTGVEDMELYSRAFGAATQDADPPQGLVDMMNEFTQAPTVDGTLDTMTAWGRLALLQEGDYPTEWLTKVVRANGLDTFGGADPDRTDFRGGSVYTVQTTGLSEDVLALAFGALKNNPEAARAALDSINPGELDETVELVYGYAKSRGTGDAVADAFGLAIEAGTGSTTEDPGKHSPEAAEFAYNFILGSGTHEDVPDMLKDSIANVAASYSHEMLTGSRTDDAEGRTSEMGKPDDFNDIPGVTPSFYLSPEATYKFIHGFADSDHHSAPFDEAMGELYNSATTAAAQYDQNAIANGRLDPEKWELAHNAFGSLAGLQYQSQLKVRGDMDASDKAFREGIAKVLTLGIGKVPTPQGFAAKWAWKGFTFAVGKGLGAYKAGGETRVDQVEADDDQVALTAKYTVATQLVASGWPHSEIPADLKGEDGELLSIDEIAGDQGKIDSFDQWTDENNTGNYNFDNKVMDGQNGLLGQYKYTETIAKDIKW